MGERGGVASQIGGGHMRHTIVGNLGPECDAGVPRPSCRIEAELIHRVGGVGGRQILCQRSQSALNERVVVARIGDRSERIANRAACPRTIQANAGVVAIHPICNRHGSVGRGITGPGRERRSIRQKIAVLYQVLRRNRCR